jgi:hypothetical protein
MARRGDNELPEVQIEVAATLPSPDGRVGTGRSGVDPSLDGPPGPPVEQSRRPSSRATRRAAAVGLVGAIVGLLALGAAMGGDTDGAMSPPTASAAASSAGTSSADAVAPSTPAPVSRPTMDDMQAPALGDPGAAAVRSASAPVRRRAGADGLDATVVLAPFPHPGSGTRSAIHVIGPDDTLTRDDAPLFPADFPTRSSRWRATARGDCGPPCSPTAPPCGRCRSTIAGGCRPATSRRSHRGAA